MICPWAGTAKKKENQENYIISAPSKSFYLRTALRRGAAPSPEKSYDFGSPCPFFALIAMDYTETKHGGPSPEEDIDHGHRL
jgi:hypothetical protein